MSRTDQPQTGDYEPLHREVEQYLSASAMAREEVSELGALELDRCPACEEAVRVEDNFVHVNRQVLHLRCALGALSARRLSGI